jgi:hypothetical protein
MQTELVMPGSTSADGLDKSQRYDANRRVRGMKLSRVWVPDTRAPGFREEAHRQALLLRGAPEEAEAFGFIEAAADRGDNET